MIHLLAVAKSFTSAGTTPRIVLRPATISLPSDRRLAVLSARRKGKSTFLRLLAGKISSDQGEIVTNRTCSPVINGGPIFNSQLTALENIRFVSRVYGTDADILLRAVASIHRVDESLTHPLKNLDGATRRNLEAAVIMMLPFQCYLIDEAGQIDVELFENCLQVASQRGAGMIFTTSQRQIALRYADAVVILHQESLYLFSGVGCAREALKMIDQE